MRRLLLFPIFIAMVFTLGAAGCSGPCDRTASPANFTSQYNATAAGETLCLNAGNYGDVTLGKSITLAPAGDTRPTLRTIDITADNSLVTGMNITGGGDPLVNIAQTAAHVSVVDNVIHDGSGNGMRNRGDDIDVVSNEFYHFGSEDAIRLWGDHHSYVDNYIHDVQNGGHNDAFQTYRTSGGDEPVTNLLLDGNTIKNFPGGNAHCFMVEDAGQANWTVRNNRFEGIGSHCFILTKPGEPGVANVQIHNNDFVNVGGTAIECHGGTSGSITGNTFSNVGGTVGHYDNSTCTGQ